jgi:tetratricopeptide (TPR) repeat protein
MQRALAIYQELAAAAPESAEAQRSVAMSSGIIGDVLLFSAKRYKEASDQYQKALDVSERLAADDPKNAQFQRDRITYLGRLADASVQAGEKAKAQVLTKRAINILKPLVDQPNPSQFFLYQYAWTLVTTPFAELRNSPEALRVAERLVELTRGTDPRTVDILARAHAAAGNYARAVEMEDKALKLLPPNSASDLRKELEANRASFQLRAASSPRK